MGRGIWNEVGRVGGSWTQSLAGHGSELELYPKCIGKLREDFRKRLGWRIGDGMWFYFNWQALISDCSMLCSQINFSWIGITFPSRITSSSLRIWGETSYQIWMNGKYQDIQIWSPDKILHIQAKILTHIRPPHSFLLPACVSNPYMRPELSIICLLLWSNMLCILI